MPEHDLEKLLGGFAADTLTPEEKLQLYSAALQDQQLFNTIADEQALKELLTDPVVRRRLLQALQTTTAGGSPSWFNWFQRPARLAWAGGLAGAVLAVVLGIRVYQESLRQEAQSIAKEEATTPEPSRSVPAPLQPATRPTNEHQATSEDKSRPSLPPMRERLTDKTAPHAPLSRTTQDERRTNRPERDAPALKAKTDTTPKQTESFTDMLSKSADETSLSAPQPITSASLPPHPTSAPLQGQLGVGGPVPSQEGASLSARSLFHGLRLQGQDKSMARDTARRERATSESAPPPDRSAIMTKPLAMAKSKRASPDQPVGIRYSLTPRAQSELFYDGVRDTATQTTFLELTVESNQDGYLQLWKHVGSSNPELLFPTSETEQPRSKLTAHTYLTISIPSTPGMLIIRFSRTDTAPSATFDSTLLDDASRHQLRESVLTDETPSFPAPIHYIINQDPSLSEIVVQISPSPP